jgi:glycosyltransferase involved in cell wall biosynthesis
MGKKKFVTYWTTCCLEPRIEAISREIEILANHFIPSRTVGISNYYSFRISKKHHLLGFGARFDPFFRPIIRFLERFTKINHVYGDMTPWIFHKTLSLKPIIHTIASDKGDPVMEFLNRCNHVVTQTPYSLKKLTQSGFDPQRIHIIYPGVDLNQFTVVHAQSSPKVPEILFATAPRSEQELADRGVYLLLEAAYACPKIHIRLLFRKWRTGHTSIHAIQNDLAIRQINNITLINETIPNMSKMFHRHHFTIIPFTQTSGGKECPNSLIESLSCGVPVLVSTRVPMAEFVEETSTGISFEPNVSSLLQAIEKGMSQWDMLAHNARKVAEKYFGLETMLRSYATLYDKAMCEGSINIR